MNLLLWIIVFVVALAVLVKGSDFFVEAAEKVGLYLGLPSFVIGVIIVGVGTSLPELVSSLVSVHQGHSEIVVGNVLGSNITNIFLVLGIAGLFSKKLHIQYDMYKLDLPMLIGSACLISLMLLDTKFTLAEALFCLVLLILYVYRTINNDNPAEEMKKPEHPGAWPWIMLFVSPLLIFLGAKFTVDAVVQISTMAGISTEVIAITAVALGTSLPEVMVSIQAARKGNAEMAVGNVIGSNIFNTLAVMGIPALFGELIIPTNTPSQYIPFFLAATLLFIIITMDKKITKTEGGLLIIFYLYFIANIYGLV